MEDLRLKWNANVEYQANLPPRVIDWNEAVGIMLAKNLKIRQMSNDLVNARENVRQVYKDFIPTLNIQAGVSEFFTDVSNLGSEDVYMNASSFFSVPGVVNFRARLYAAQLMEFRARSGQELAEREQKIELYRLFFTAEELRDRTARLEIERATAQAMEQVDPFSGQLMLTETETLELANLREERVLQDRVSEALGSRDYRWILSPEGLPDLRYDETPLPLTDTNRVAQLQMRLLAVELEAARAQLLGLKLRYWPELHIGISSPPVYSRSGGNEEFWDSEKVRFTANLIWNIDTRGNLSRGIRFTKRQQEIQRERYRQESLALINRLIFTQQLIASVRQQLQQVEAQLTVMEAVPPAQTFADLEKYAVDYRTLTAQQLQLKRELSELNALFWFVDEYAWPREQEAPKT
ncbi:MAG TPA: TolC family protein [Candidatus Kapabacteria bacterium]|nr:TolC family protein [Candidatus Kapabacteria bacterium]